MLFRSDRKSTRLNSSHLVISYAVFCLKKKKNSTERHMHTTRMIISDIWRCSWRQRGSAGGREALVRRRRRSALCPPGSYFFFNDTATTEIYTLSLHDALPICPVEPRWQDRRHRCSPECRSRR